MSDIMIYMKNNQFIRKTLALLTVFTSFAIIGCFSPWKGNEAVISIFLGNADGAKVILDSEFLNQLEYSIVLSSGTYSKTIKHTGAGLVTATVAPGIWLIEVEASMDKEPFASGSARKEITAGRQNSVSILMKLYWQEPEYLVTKNADDILAPAEGSLRQVLSTAPPGATIGIKLESGNEIVLGNTLTIDKNITIVASSNVTIKREALFTDSIFSIPRNTNASLTLGDFAMPGILTIEGNKEPGPYYSPLIRVGLNSSLVLNEKVVLCNNNTAYDNGSAVNVTGGYFYMYGGTIRDNETGNNGGGVYVSPESDGSEYYGGVFRMDGGTISGNTAAEYGGGVYVDSILDNNSGEYCVGEFTMEDGTISGNTAVACGGGVYACYKTLFLKDSRGIIYGHTGTGTANSNKANDTSTHYRDNPGYAVFPGNAVFIEGINAGTDNEVFPMVRNTDALKEIVLDSMIAGYAGGWE